MSKSSAVRPLVAVSSKSSGIKMIALSALVASPSNVRRSKDKPSRSLASSILAYGVLHNLTAVAVDDGTIEVIAGGRRLAALQWLAKTKQVPAGYLVPVRVVDAAAATELSLSENFHTQAMHPVDEYKAFAALADEGKTVEDIAAHFGVTEQTVKQRFKLASVAPSLLALCQKGELTVDQLVALSITDDQALQLRVWKQASGWQRNPSELRKALTHGEVELATSGAAQFVGVDAYQAAGGAIRSDMFSSAVYLSDRTLVESLATDKLAALAEPVKAEGWAWVEVRTRNDHSEIYTFGRLARTLREQTPAELKKSLALEKERDKLDLLLSEDDGSDEAALLKAQERRDDIDEELDTLDEARRVPDESGKPFAGALLILESDGTVRIERGLIKPADKKAYEAHKAGVAANDDPAKPGEADASSETESGLPHALTRKLTEARTAALRARIAVDPTTAIVALAHNIIVREFYSGTSQHTALTLRLGVVACDGGDAARTALAAQRNALAALLPEDAGDAWAWALKQTEQTLLPFIAFGVALSVDTSMMRSDQTHTQSGANATAVQQLASAATLDMADYWQATPETYLTSVPKSLIVDAVREAVNEDAATAVGKLKKGEAVKEAAAALAGTRWVPAVLR